MPSKKNIETLQEIKDRLKKNRVLIVADYTGLKVSDFTALRKELKKNDNLIKVYKNRLVKIALKEEGKEGLDKYLKGVSAFIFGNDEVTSSKIIYDFSKKKENLKAKVIMVDGKIYEQKMIETLAKIPPKEELYGEVVGSLNTPITTLVYVLDNLISTLVYTLESIKNQKEDR